MSRRARRVQPWNSSTWEEDMRASASRAIPRFVTFEDRWDRLQLKLAVPGAGSVGRARRRPQKRREDRLANAVAHLAHVERQ
jgi:hypothetical protein